MSSRPLTGKRAYREWAKANPSPTPGFAPKPLNARRTSGFPAQCDNKQSVTSCQLNGYLRMSCLTDYPPRLCASSTHPELTYQRADKLYVIKSTDQTLQRNVALTLEDEGVTYLVMHGEPAPTADAGAVYMGNGGLMFVPTGRVFVRLDDGMSLEAHAEAFRKLGYAIVQALPYALNAGWLEHAQKDTAEALRGIPELARLPGVQHVEPQLLTVRAQR
jgi:hypothetical protein